MLLQYDGINAFICSEVLIIAAREFITLLAWLESNSHNTAENAQFGRSLLLEYGINKIVLVTQAYHMPRAVNEFRKAGFDVLP